MHNGGRPPTLFTEEPARSVSQPARLAARYRDLQAELIERVKEVRGPYPAAEMARHAVDGSIKPHDAIILAEQIDAQRPCKILEVGSFIGFSTRWLLECSRPSGATVVSIDPNIRHRVFDQPGDLLRRFNADFLPGRLVLRCGFFSQKMTGDCYYDYEHFEPFLSRPEVDKVLASRPLLTSGNLNEGKFDFIFIDGDHSANAVLGNFTEALALLNPGGRIAFHDALTWPDVARALEILADRCKGIGTVEVFGQVGTDCPVGSCDGVGVFCLR